MNARPIRPSLCLVTHSLDRGGSPISLWNLASRIPAGNRVLITEKDGPLRQIYESSGILVRIVQGGGFLRPRLFFKMYRVLAQSRPDIVHLNTLTSYYKYAAVAAWMLGIPVAWFIRENVTERRCQKLLPWLRHCATAIVPVSHEIARALGDPRLVAKTEVIHNGIHLSSIPPRTAVLREQLKLPQNLPLIGCVAALEPRKGILDLVEAMGLLHARGINAALVCLGRDRSRSQAYRLQVEERIARLGLQTKVFLTGDYENPLSAYASFQVFALPTHWEGCARTLLEAMACRCPVVATNCGGNPEIIQDGANGFLVPPGNPAALADALARMLGNPARAAELAECGFQTIASRFTIEEHVRRVSNLYQTMLKA